MLVVVHAILIACALIITSKMKILSSKIQLLIEFYTKRIFILEELSVLTHLLSPSLYYVLLFALLAVQISERNKDSVREGVCDHPFFQRKNEMIRVSATRPRAS